MGKVAYGQPLFSSWTNFLESSACARPTITATACWCFLWSIVGGVGAGNAGASVVHDCADGIGLLFADVVEDAPWPCLVGGGSRGCPEVICTVRQVRPSFLGLLFLREDRALHSASVLLWRCLAVSCLPGPCPLGGVLNSSLSAGVYHEGVLAALAGQTFSSGCGVAPPWCATAAMGPSSCWGSLICSASALV
jgi:hypothetical protein